MGAWVLPGDPDTLVNTEGAEPGLEEGRKWELRSVSAGGQDPHLPSHAVLEGSPNKTVY